MVYGITIHKKQTTDIATPIEIKDNSLIGYDYSKAIFMESGTYCIVKNNTGFENRKFGESSFVNGQDSILVSAPLYGIPKSIIVTPKGNSNIWVDTVNNTGFTVRRNETAGNLLFYWSAEI